VNRYDFSWLTEQISEVKTRDFFHLGSSHEIDRTAIGGLELPLSYVEFIGRFGQVALYKQHAGYLLGVYANPRIGVDAKTGEDVVCIGHYGENTVCFLKELCVSDGDAPVFETGPGGTKRVAERFDLWLSKRCADAKKSYGRKRWAQIVRGPKPFDNREKGILKARKNLAWKMLGIGDDGFVEFEIVNNANMTLPFYSVGVNDSRGGFAGVAYLRIGDVAPGETRTVKHDCYVEYIPREYLKIYELPEPIPEKREEYWEFDFE